MTPENTYHHPGGFVKCRVCNQLARERHQAKTHCSKGHELTPETSYREKGRTRCRVCKRLASEAYRAREYPKTIGMVRDNDVVIKRGVEWPEGCFKGQDVDDITLAREATRQRFMPQRHVTVRYGVPVYG